MITLTFLYLLYSYCVYCIWHIKCNKRSKALQETPRKLQQPTKTKQWKKLDQGLINFSLIILQVPQTKSHPKAAPPPRKSWANSLLIKRPHNRKNKPKKKKLLEKRHKEVEEPINYRVHQKRIVPQMNGPRQAINRSRARN